MIDTRDESEKTPLPPLTRRVPVDYNKNLPEEAPLIPGTEAIRKEHLKVGMFYRCLLADDRKVQYIGGGRIKWYSASGDEYKYAEVHDYQLAPLTP